MNAFNQALSYFTGEVASGGAIRHLADLGYTVDEIFNELTYPTPRERVQSTVWEHYISNGTIRLTEPEDGGHDEKVSYIKEQDAFGNVSFRRVVRNVEAAGREYILCDFGKRRYMDKEAFEGSLGGLDGSDREYVLGLPWTVEAVYHIANERMKRIAAKLDMNVYKETKDE